MNILYINHYAGSLRHGMEFRPYYLSREWTRQGHHVKIVASSYSHVRSSNPKMGDSQYLAETVDGVPYVWLKTNSYTGNGLGRVLNIFYFLFQLLCYLKIITNNFKPDMVIASSTYPLDIFPAYYYAKKFKAKLVFEVHDLWPLSPVELGGISKWHPFILLLQFAESFAYKNADVVVSMLPAAKSYMIERGMNEDKFVHIPNGISFEEWVAPISELPQEIQKTISELKSKNHRLIGYAGSHGVANSLDTLILAAKILKSEAVSFIFVGSGSEKERLLQLKNQHNIDNIYFFEAISKELVPSLLSTLDIAYIGWKRQPLYRFGISPNKLMDYMMSGTPILHSVEAGNDPVADAQCGLTVPAENPEKVAEGLLLLLSKDSSELERMGQNGKAYIIENNLYSVLAKKFIEGCLAKVSLSKNILYINHYAGSLKHGMEFRPYYMARDWVRKGHKVLIVASSESHVRAQKIQLDNSYQEETIDDVTYLWCKTRSYVGNGIGRVLNIGSFIFALFKKTYYFSKTFKPDAVIASSTYPLDIFPSWLFAKLSGAKLIYEVHDLWPLSPMELGGMSKYHPFIMLLQFGEDFACRFADTVVCMLPKAKEHLVSRGMKPEKFLYVPNGIDLSEWSHSEKPNESLKKYPLMKVIEDCKKNNEVTVAYLGAHGLANGLENLLSAALILQEKNASVRVIFVGSGSEKNHLKNLATKLNLRNVYFSDPVLKGDIPFVTGLFDILYIGLQKQSLFRFGISPNKMMDYMASGKPIINAIEAGNDPVLEAHCGVSIPPESPEKLAEVILQLKTTDPVELLNMGERGKEYVLENHEYSKLSERFLRVLV